MAKTTTPNSEYDLVLDASILSEIEKKGWKLKTSQEKTKQIINFISTEKIAETDGILIFNEKQMNELSAKVFPCDEVHPSFCAFGAFNKGKTTILNWISGNKFGTGKLHTTEGLSIKLPVPNETTFGIVVDVAGGNTPISEELLFQTTEEVENSTDPSIIEQLKKIKEDKNDDEIKTKVAKFIRKRAIVNKKTNEQVLLDLVFAMVDVVLFVVNEMTWHEQQNIEVIKAKIDRDYENAKGKIPKQKLVVIHNYNLATTMVQFDKLKKKFVTDCYEGEASFGELNVKGFDKRVPYWTWISTGDIRHVFLGHQPEDPKVTTSEPAALINPGSIQFLKDYLSSQFVQKKGSYLKRLSDAVRINVSNYFVDEYKQMELVWNSKEQMLYFRAKANEKPNKLVRDVLEYDGGALVVRSSQFKPDADIFYDAKIGGFPKNMLVVLDIPGAGWKDLKSPPRDPMLVPADDRTPDIVVSTLGQTKMIVKGNKQLVYYPTSDLNAPKKVVDSAEEILLLNEIRTGPFSRVFEIPNEFSAEKKDWKINHYNGVTQVILPEENDGSDSDD